MAGSIPARSAAEPGQRQRGASSALQGSGPSVERRATRPGAHNGGEDFVEYVLPILVLAAIALVVIAILRSVHVVTIRDYERGLRFRRGRLAGLVDPGMHITFAPFSRDPGARRAAGDAAGGGPGGADRRRRRRQDQPGGPIRGRRSGRGGDARRGLAADAVPAAPAGAARRRDAADAGRDAGGAARAGSRGA